MLARGKEQVITYLSEEKITAGDEHTSNYTVAQDAYGTPEDCIRYVTRLQEAGADEILFMFQMGGIPHAAHHAGHHAIRLATRIDLVHTHIALGHDVLLGNEL